ncbi:bifunctional 2-C-methyl-D-erythritol 4-phosphate cytidylyltransferase/2-C-methyl-D-erythritol 2,4-cyclodiphosphate synthase [Parasphingorhabdus halotolerans]|uniref:Bifunctional enzyme IspD/IspF n=1 Tax=Parasphingorhabdus halotolerans TaxID=2725558 RepID=A0A6H2DR65_9SPHN|nr:bifunctional 2-C-methyl-D-erythritol 4-phosphate cytidylyltransferase/2-C-methyl-D-erythritol 2,4-cyclodiphosphate synthase [Parasphingorhabdus halotolerans]QJB70617.1 bifunctional 2-C-methyl-D-erythritol 4-phosphate cytidylyltransferase/2-C-methyl-D-erythritol 2,4-cyclodiphosphate synthase [Parasphingorhabdus halotolerans]
MSDSSNSANATHAVVLAAGSGSRSGLSRPKQFERVRGKPIVRHSVDSFLSHAGIDKLWVVIGAGQEELANEALSGCSAYYLVIGGDTRQQSVRNTLNAIAQSGGAQSILIHDAARPFLSRNIIDSLLAVLKTEAGAMPVLPAVDTMISTDGQRLGQTLDREKLRRVQTPQAFDFEKLLAAHDIWPEDITATDDAQIFQAAGHDIHLIEGDENLAKYTFPSDFERTPMQTQIRTGMGFDVHQLVAGEELWLGGMKIDHVKGLSGHSDADVLLHALTDALLGAIGAGDIGDHFPPTDAKWQGAASEQFVKYATELIAGKGGTINNVDMTLICEAPKIKPHREAIRANIATVLDIALDQVSVKATTTERLGFAGREEGIAAQAIATISLEKI